MQQNQCKATSSRSANSDEQIKGWILLLLHHEPQDKIKSFTDTRERISGRGTKLFDIRKVFSTRWDRLSRQPGKMSRTGKKKFDIRQVFFHKVRLPIWVPSVFFAGPCWGSVPWIPSRGCVWPATWRPRWTTQRLHGCQTECVKKKLFGAWKSFFSFLACWPASGDRK